MLCILGVRRRGSTLLISTLLHFFPIHKPAANLDIETRIFKYKRITHTHGQLTLPALALQHPLTTTTTRTTYTEACWLRRDVDANVNVDVEVDVGFDCGIAAARRQCKRNIATLVAGLCALFIF